VWSRTLANDLLGVPHRLTFNSDGQRLVAIGSDWTDNAGRTSRAGQLTLWDVSGDTAEEVRRIGLAVQQTPLFEELAVTAFSRDGNRLAVNLNKRAVAIWDARTGKEVCSLRGLADSPTTMTFGADGRRLLTTNNEPNAARVWDTVTGHELLSLPLGQGSIEGLFALKSLHFDGQRLRVVEGSRLRVIDGRPASP
jgi:WD40 repeat protein